MSVVSQMPAVLIGAAPRRSRATAASEQQPGGRARASTSRSRAADERRIVAAPASAVAEREPGPLQRQLRDVWQQRRAVCAERAADRQRCSRVTHASTSASAARLRSDGAWLRDARAAAATPRSGCCAPASASTWPAQGRGRCGVSASPSAPWASDRERRPCERDERGARERERPDRGVRTQPAPGSPAGSQPPRACREVRLLSSVAAIR